LEKLLHASEKIPVFVIVDLANIPLTKELLKTPIQDVLDRSRWPILPELVNRFFVHEKQEDTLRVVNYFLYEMLKKSTDVIIGHNGEYITFVNDLLVELLEYQDASDLVGKSLDTIVYLEDVSEDLLNFVPAKENISLKQGDHIRLIKNGGYVFRAGIQAMELSIDIDYPVLWQVKPKEYGLDSLPVGDVQGSELLIKHADQAPGVLYQFHLVTVDPIQIQFPFVSDRLGDISAIPVDELRQDGNVFFDYMHEEDVQAFANLGFESQANLSTWSMDFRLKAKEGGYRWIHGTSKPVYLSDGSCLWYGYMEDITDAKEAEAAFKNSQVQVKTLFEDAPDGIVVLDQDANIVRWNPKAVKIFGWDAEEVVGQRLYEIITPKRYHDYHDKNLLRFQAGEKNVLLNQSVETWAIHKDGHEFPIMVNIAGMETHDEKLLLCFIVDITKRKQAQDKLQDSLKEKEVLLKEIHHRVKNNMQVITSLLSLQSSFITDNSIKDIFKKSQYRINSMGMVHEMLYQSDDLSKINYKEYLKRLTDSLKQAMTSATQEIEVLFNLPTIVCFNVDTAIPLSLIVNELLTNAFKYAFVGRTKGQIKLSLERLKSKKYVFLIEDNGVGYPKEPPKDKAPSLGLLLVDKLARQLHGTLERLSVEQGTAYRLLFDEIATS
jgi:PAS domain S-box-containing protein